METILSIHFYLGVWWVMLRFLTGQYHLYLLFRNQLNNATYQKVCKASRAIEAEIISYNRIASKDVMTLLAFIYYSFLSFKINEINTNQTFWTVGRTIGRARDKFLSKAFI